MKLIWKEVEFKARLFETTLIGTLEKEYPRKAGNCLRFLSPVYTKCFNCFAENYEYIGKKENLVKIKCDTLIDVENKRTILCLITDLAFPKNFLNPIDSYCRLCFTEEEYKEVRKHLEVKEEKKEENAITKT